MNGALRICVSLTLGACATVTYGANIDPVYIVTDSGEEGNGARFAIGENCVLVTAQHVVEDTSAPFVTPIRSPQDRARVVKADRTLDIGLAVQSDSSRRSCAPMPSDEAIQGALVSSLREVWYITANGDARPFKVDLLQTANSKLTLQIVPNPSYPSAPSAFIPGMSGALVVFDGIPVAILQSSDTNRPVAEASRLDFIRRQFADTFREPAKTMPTQAPKAWVPYDVAQLPEEYQRIVKEARANKSKAIKSEQEAMRVRRKAEDASLIAKQYEKDVIVNSYSNYDADNGNFYAGQVYKVGIQKGSQGYGVAEVQKGDSVGNKFFCRFVRDTGCEGWGVFEFASNKGNKSEIISWAGGVSEGAMSGLGHMRWRPNDPTDSVEAWFYHSPETPVPGVWLMNDGRLYEGEIGNNWQGRAALWDKNGKLIRFGTWSNGQIGTTGVTTEK